MITSGIDRIYISVKDMDESLAFYRDWVGMMIVADQPLESDQIQQLWNLPKDTKARAVLLRKDEQPTMLELIEFKPHSGKTIKADTQIWDYGIDDICFMVKDIEKTYNGLIKKGFRFVSPPVFYSPGFVPFDVKETILIGPNEMRIAHVEVVSDLEPEAQRDLKVPVIKEDYGLIVDSAQIVEDMDEVIRFYRDILGLTLVGDHKMPQGALNTILPLPPGIDVRIALFNKEGSPPPVVEFLEFSRKGKSLASVAKPPNLGIFMISFETDDLSGLMKRLKEEGFPVVAGPVEMEIAPYGKIQSVIVEGPSKITIEFFQNV